MVHSLLVTCVSPHEAIVYTGPHTPRLERFIRTTPHHYNTSIKQHSTETKPAADTLRRLGYQLHESVHNHLSRFKSNKVYYNCPFEDTTTHTWQLRIATTTSQNANMSFLLRTSNIVRQRLFTTSTRARNAISMQDAAAAQMTSTPGASVVPRLGRVAKW